MASINWKKMTAKDLDGSVVHFDKKERERHNHANLDIDKLQTYLNYDLEDSYRESIYQLKDKVKAFDKIKPPKRNMGYNKRVIAIALEVICPDEIANKYAGADDDFFKTIYKCEKKFFGENLVAYGGVHKDEMHSYVNTKTNKLEVSRSHLHSFIIPFTNENGVNGREFAKRDKYYRFNKYCDSAIFKQFGIHLNNFEGRNDWGNVDSLKKDSALFELNMSKNGKTLINMKKENDFLSRDNETMFNGLFDVMEVFKKVNNVEYSKCVKNEINKFGNNSIISQIAKTLSEQTYGVGNWHKDPIWREIEEEEREKKRKKDRSEGRIREI